jgi:hypothetical protein
MVPGENRKDGQDTGTPLGNRFLMPVVCEVHNPLKPVPEGQFSRTRQAGVVDDHRVKMKNPGASSNLWFDGVWTRPSNQSRDQRNRRGRIRRPRL